MAEYYSCRNDVLEHRRKVKYWMDDFANQLVERAKRHDASKLQEPERAIFDKWTPNLRQVQFGSEEYKAALAAMGKGLQHHYAENRHHPEHYENGINGMTLVDLVEMVCDWMAAAEAKNTPVDTTYLSNRFNIYPQLVGIIINTFRDADFWKQVNNVPCVNFSELAPRSDSMSLYGTAEPTDGGGKDN